MSVGYEVAQPLVAEAYDLIGYHPILNEFAKFQVKTIRRRSDRDDQMVLYAKKGNGQAYTTDDADYMLGVDGSDVYMMEVRGISEYWASEATAAKRWVKLTADAETNESEAV